MVASSLPPNLNLPRQKSPDKVSWPSQFVADDRSLLIAGAFEKDEVPFGSGICLLCNTGDLATPHILEREHTERRIRLCEDYLCMWQELRAPDLRPYYYDHLSHTWSFAKPRSMQVPRCNPEAEAEAGDADAASFGKRLRQVLIGSPGPAVASEDDGGGAAAGCAAGTGDPRGASTAGTILPGQGFAYVDSGTDQGCWQCEFCNRFFSTDLAVQQHLTSMSGRKGHPTAQGMWYDTGWQRGDLVASGAGGAGAAGVPAFSATAPSPARPGNQQYLSADGDVLEAERDGQKYFYNPRTGATSWTREGLIQLNQNFYARLTIHHVQSGQQCGPQGEEIWWSWRDVSGSVVHNAWTLTELYTMATP